MINISFSVLQVLAVRLNVLIKRFAFQFLNKWITVSYTLNYEVLVDVCVTMHH